MKLSAPHRRRGAALATLGLVLGLLLVGTPTSDAAVRTSGETTSTVSGTLVQVPGEGKVADQWAVQPASGDAVPVRFASTKGLTPGNRVTVSTRAGLSRVIASAATPRPRSARAGAAHHSYVAILDNPAFGIAPTPSVVKAEVNAADAWWMSQSGGHISSFSVASVATPYASTVATTGNECGANDVVRLFNEAAAKFRGVNFNGTTNHLDIFVSPTNCPVEGLGTEGVVRHWTGGAALMTFHQGSRGTIEHETGHHFGLQHAWGRVCFSSCLDGEYFDLFSVMGLALDLNGTFREPGTLDTSYRIDEGITNPGEVQSLSIGGGRSRTVVRGVLPRSNTSGVRALAVRDARTGQVYYVSLRSGTGRDAGTCYTTTCSVGAAPNGTNQVLNYRRGITIEQRRAGNGMTALSRRVSGGFDFFFSTGTSYTSPSGGITVRVDAVSSTSARVTVALRSARRLTHTPRPRIVGKARVGRRLRAKHGTWNKGVHFHYQWYAGGRAIRKATHPTYKITRGARHKRITVRVTGTKTGYVTVSRKSKATGKVR